MSLTELTLLGTVDKVEIALERIRTFEPDEGYYVAFSGGKDSQVVLDLVERSGVKFDAHMNVTTVDPPELMRFVREHYEDRVALHKPRRSMYQLIAGKRLPPTRLARYCCGELKERGGDGRRVVTGIRWQESSRRAKRQYVESCRYGKGKTYLHPIIDWTHGEVWEYLNGRGLPHCSLYDDGHKRIGCVMCPLTDFMKRDAERWPKFAAMYRRACRAAFERDPENRGEWTSGDDIYEWWINGVRRDSDDPELFPLDN